MANWDGPYQAGQTAAQAFAFPPTPQLSKAPQPTVPPSATSLPSTSQQAVQMNSTQCDVELDKLMGKYNEKIDKFIEKASNRIYQGLRFQSMQNQLEHKTMPPVQQQQNQQPSLPVEPQPPLPVEPQPPQPTDLPPPEVTAKYAFACLDYLRGDCKRANCIFSHTVKKALQFCHDYQNKKRCRENCRFLHGTNEEERVYNETGRLPADIFEREVYPDQATRAVQPPYLDQATRTVQPPYPDQATRAVQPPCPEQATRPVQPPYPDQATRAVQPPYPDQATRPVQPPYPDQATMTVQPPSVPMASFSTSAPCSLQNIVRASMFPPQPSHVGEYQPNPQQFTVPPPPLQCAMPPPPLQCAMPPPPPPPSSSQCAQNRPVPSRLLNMYIQTYLLQNGFNTIQSTERSTSNEQSHQTFVCNQVRKAREVVQSPPPPAEPSSAPASLPLRNDVTRPARPPPPNYVRQYHLPTSMPTPPQPAAAPPITCLPADSLPDEPNNGMALLNDELNRAKIIVDFCKHQYETNQEYLQLLQAGKEKILYGIAERVNQRLGMPYLMTNGQPAQHQRQL